MLMRISKGIAYHFPVRADADNRWWSYRLKYYIMYGLFEHLQIIYHTHAKVCLNKLKSQSYFCKIL